MMADDLSDLNLWCWLNVMGVEDERGLVHLDSQIMADN